MAAMQRDPSRGQMKLGAFFHPTGHHVASWLHPDSQIDAGTNFRHYVELAQMSERAKFDLMFLADALAVRDGNLEPLSRWPQYMAYFEPITLLAGIAGQTERIGLVATATTSYNEPYNVARKFASLDHISGGRAGWNVVTSANLSEAFNFGREAHYDHGERYDRALEFTEVVCGLWDSWDDDAFLRDRATGRYFNPVKLHTLNHKGAFLRARTAERRTAAAGASSDLPGRFIRGRAGTRGAYGRGGVHAAAFAGGRSGVLSGPEGAHGQIRSFAGASEGHARAQSDRRPHRAGGEGQASTGIWKR